MGKTLHGVLGIKDGYNTIQNIEGRRSSISFISRELSIQIVGEPRRFCAALVSTRQDLCRQHPVMTN